LRLLRRKLLQLRLLRRKLLQLRLLRRKLLQLRLLQRRSLQWILTFIDAAVERAAVQLLKLKKVINAAVDRKRNHKVSC
jgi:hypothetical protein